MRQIKRFIFQTFRKTMKNIFEVAFVYLKKFFFVNRQTTSQDKVQELFAKYGTIVNFKWISKEGNKMALIEMSTLEEAVLSLIVREFFVFVLNFRHAFNL